MDAFGFFFGIALIVCASALHLHIKARSKRQGIEPEMAERLEQRIGGLERRLNDIQDIVLAIDDKLAQQKKQEE